MTVTVCEVKMDFDQQIRSPSGMCQLIRYFEIQSQRLDRQHSLASSQSAVSCLDSQFESLIKFNGVPILAPAITSSRRDALRKHKKDAVLFEKKLKLRQHRIQQREDLINAAETNDVNVLSPDNLYRPAARQLNFDLNVHQNQQPLTTSGHHKQVSATHSLSILDTAETNDKGADEDFVMPTIDSMMNSGLMSFETDGGSLPTIFSGHTLKSLKEQKISHNLDHLCKALNVTDLGSTSGSDLSDALGNTTKQHGVENENDGLVIRVGNLTRDTTNAVSFCHESQDTVVEVSHGVDNYPQCQKVDNSPVPGSIKKDLEQDHYSSRAGSPGSATTSDSQKSKVHFASFILEYNTSASQSFESTTVVKKKISPGVRQEEDCDRLEPPALISKANQDPKFKQSVAPKRVIEGERENDFGNLLLNHVSLQNDGSDSSLTISSPSELVMTTKIPFQSHGCVYEALCGSDKENEGVQSSISRHQEFDTRYNSTAGHQGSINYKESPDNERMNQIRKAGTEVYDHQKVSNNTLDLPVSMQQINLVTSSSASANTSQVTSLCDSANLVSISQLSINLPAVSEGSINHLSVTESRSSALTGTSGSSSSTIKEDLTPKNSTNDLGMNIVEYPKDNDTNHQAIQSSDGITQNKKSHQKGQETTSFLIPFKNKLQKHFKQNKAAHVSKDLLGINDDKVRSDEEFETSGQTEQNRTPPPRLGGHVHRGSYTLSHPSPGHQFKVRDKGEKKKHEGEEKEKIKTHSNGIVGSEVENSSVLRKKLDFNELLQDLDEPLSIQEHKNVFSESMPSADLEKEGKAEHINKYLKHVEFQNSMNLNSFDHVCSLEDTEDIVHLNIQYQEDENNVSENMMNKEEEEVKQTMPGADSILQVLHSIADSQSSVCQLSDFEVQSLHQQQMELARRALVEQQRRDMEELFVQQRKEIMKFETEIRLAQRTSLEQHKFLLQNLPENVKMKASHNEEKYSLDTPGNYHNQSMDVGEDISLNYNQHHHHYENPCKNSHTSSINSQDNIRPQSGSNRHPPNEHFSLNLEYKAYSGSTAPKHGVELTSKKITGNSSSSPPSYQDSHHHNQAVENKTFPSQRSHNATQDSVVDVEYKIPGFGSPSISSPRMHRSVGFKFNQFHHSRHPQPVNVPSEAYQSLMSVKFDKVTALAKGFLTRCLMRSDKVQGLIKTIRDTQEFFINFQTETPIKKGNLSSQDKALLDRLQAQLQGALYDIHEIFFELSTGKRMILIEQTRVKEYSKIRKGLSESTNLGRSSFPRMSQATMKALERKRKAREAEAIAILSTSTSLSRPKTGSYSASNSPRSNNNSPRLHSHTESRALRPLQRQQSHQTSTSNARGDNSHKNTNNLNKDKKDKGHNPPERQLTRPKRISFPSSKHSHLSASAETDANSSLTKQTTSTTCRTLSKAKAFPGTSSSNNKSIGGKPSKSSWR